MITDDDLLLYYYRDGLEAVERARIGAAIASDPQLAQRLQALVARLDAAAAMPEVPVPAEVQQRWQAALAREANKHDAKETRAPRATFRWQAAAAAVTAVALFFVARIVMHTTPDQTVEVTPPPPTDGATYERGLKWHLASTEQQLAELGSATPEERKRLIETIAAQNRMYALAADRAGEPQLARVLRAFAPILESLEQGGGDPSASIAQLSFELRVMQGRLSAGTDKPSTTL